MSTLTAHAVLQTWEHARAEHPLRRSLALLRMAWPEAEEGHGADWGQLPLGTRDAWLFRLREMLFGQELDTIAACPACQETLQTQFATSDLQPTADDTGHGGASLQLDGFELDFRLPASDDLIAVAELDTVEAATRQLLERCVLQARHHGSPTTASELPPAVVDRLQLEMAQLDPGADTTIALTCPACGHGFERRFDIGAYLWDELDDWAQRTLGEVHLLASAYGWSESQILGLSAARRGHYIALVQS